MEQPKCKICGNRHRLGACPKSHTELSVGDVTAIKLPKKYKPAEKPKYDRNEAHRVYMKKYMAIKRASDKLKKGKLK